MHVSLRDLGHALVVVVVLLGALVAKRVDAAERLPARRWSAGRVRGFDDDPGDDACAGGLELLHKGLL
jgi:hypothetical protein